MTLLFRHLRALFPALLVLLALGTAQPSRAAFVPGTEDVPLAPGLTAAAEETLVFDNPTGRIVQAKATGAADPDAVTRFYAETLPQLGWSRGSDGRWVRAGEVLDIGIALDAPSRRLIVRYQLSPRPER